MSLTLDDTQLTKLASELAKKARPAHQVLKDFGIKARDLDELKDNPFFQRVLEAFVIAWNEASNAPQRVQIGTAVMLEDALPILGKRLKSYEEPLNSQVELAKFFARTAGIGEQAPTQNPGERFIITINLGNDEKLKFNRSIAPDPNDVNLIEAKAND